ncbi:MAG: cytochrome C [Planctomycetota bacterium]|nr:cytochrome C [Planctomycetota bacterium]
MKRISVLMIAVGLVGMFAASAQAAHSNRNGVYRCARCHVPHAAGRDASGNDIAGAFGVPLWSPIYNVDGLKYTYNLYSSAKFDALGTDIGQPDGASKMCLGCHDGSANPFTGKANVSTAARVFTNAAAPGTTNSLTRSHPVSFTYDSTLSGKNPGLKAPSDTSGLGGTIATDMLDSKGKMQCTSCHNVHEQGIGADMLKIAWDPAAVPATDGDLCRICHNK